MDKPRGWRKDPRDERDLLYRVAPRAVLPPIIDLQAQLPRDKTGKVLVRYQGSVGSCTGHGIGVNLCSVATEIGQWPKQALEWFSPTWIYNGARFLEDTLNEDLGAYPRDCLEWLRMKGTLLEHFWPYKDWVLDKSDPNIGYPSHAEVFPNFAYTRIVDGVNGILTALADGHMVSLGAPWPDKWCTVDTDNTGVLPDVVAEDFSGSGHETCIFKADQTTHTFFGINSWGEWGGNFGVTGAARGFYSMPFSALAVFKQVGGYDAHILTFDPLAVKPPEPPKPGCLLGGWLGKLKRA